VLRLALAQALRLRTPGHAAIATVLPLVDGGPRKLVHGVFGTLSRQGVALPDRPTLPDGLRARWTEAWGVDVAESAAQALAAPPPLDLSLADPRGTSDWAERLAAVSLAPGHLRLEGEHRAIPDLPGFAEGAWWVQDLAASLPARMLADVDGTVLDLCAAPGGKTLQLAAQGKMVTAVDASESRLARLRENLSRTGLPAAVVRADLRDWAPPAPVDAVLLDAPCSATGIFRRHPGRAPPGATRPDRGDGGVAGRAARAGGDWVRPGGTLLYATCSLEPEEGEVQLRRFLGARSDYAVDPPRPGELPVDATAEGFVRTTPATLAELGGCDGFFIARLRRTI
jgi:16S rRNA (cytosine967-C5)-methyltransferase